MNILFVTRPDALTRPGGDTIQLQKTQQALEALGVRVRLGQPEGGALAWADIVHVFNAQTPATALPALQAARAAGKKAVLSTIWWDLSHARLVERLARFALSPSSFWAGCLPLLQLTYNGFRPGYGQAVGEVLRAADLLLPNSEEEMGWLRRDFGNALPPYRVVMNAVDTKMFTVAEAAERNGVICCARLEPTKNQLSLVRAVTRLPGVRLTLVGQAGRQEEYVRQVRIQAQRQGFTLIEDHLPHLEVAALMREHAVHALPSFRESPGLSSLEALASGLNAVVSSRPFCPIDTYFDSWCGERVFTCVPYRMDSMRSALVSALRQSNLPATFPARLTWPAVARQTLEAYRAL